MTFANHWQPTVMRLLSVGALTACHTGAPVLARLTPTTADVSRGAPVDILVEGRGFAPRNTVQVGGLTFTDIPRQSARTLRFTLPATETPRAGIEAPPAALSSGSYPVTVVTRAGTSNALPLHVMGVAR
jgi:hypothetical protein